MHPVLFRIPLPGVTVPLMPALLMVAALGAVLALFGYRKKATDLLIIGAVAAGAAAIAGFAYRGEVYTLSPLPVYSYGAMLCLSIVVGWYLTLGLASKDGLPRETMANCYFVTAVSALVGARLLYVVTNLGEFPSFQDLFALRRGGLVAYGGFLGGFVGSWLFLRKQRIRLLPWADVAVPSLATGLIITRLGCYLYGCDFGKPLGDGAPAWLRSLGTFPRWSDSTLIEGSGSPAWIQHVNQRGLSAEATESLPVHPTQLYEVLVGLVLLVLVLAVRKNQRFRGQVFLAFTLGYGLLRFLLEVLRDDAERGEFGPHFAEQVLWSGALVIFGAAFAFGPARSIASDGVRNVARVAALLPGIAVFFALRPETFAQSIAVQLSTSQWIGLLTGVGAAVAWATLLESAKRSPEAAMSLGEGALLEDDAPDSESEAAEPEAAEPDEAESDDGDRGGEDDVERDEPEPVAQDGGDGDRSPPPVKVKPSKLGKKKRKKKLSRS